jgi:hypothetical protein
MCPHEISHKTDILCALCKKDNKKWLDKWIIVAPNIWVFAKTTL